MTAFYKPGDWVQYRGKGYSNNMHVVVHNAAYIDRDETHYLIYSFNAKGSFKSAGVCSQKHLKRSRAPAFAKDVIVFPELCKPVLDYEKSEGLFRGGMVYEKKNLVVVDTMVMHSKVLAGWICDYFREHDTGGPCPWDCDGAVFQKASWLHPNNA